MCIGSERNGMGKEERKTIVLRLLDESNLSLTPYVLFRNLKDRGATFERRTLGNYLRELVEDGFVE
jgi:repressor of nif and glnA expression